MKFRRRWGCYKREFLFNTSVCVSVWLCECVSDGGTSVRVRIGTDLIFRGRVRAPRNSGNDLGIDHGIFQSRRTPDEPPFATNPLVAAYDGRPTLFLLARNKVRTLPSRLLYISSRNNRAVVVAAAL